MPTQWQIAVAAEALAAAQFARCGFDVSVQYGANQPEYDLIVAKGERLLKVSVKAVMIAAGGSHNRTCKHSATPWGIRTVAAGTTERFLRAGDFQKSEFTIC